MEEDQKAGQDAASGISQAVKSVGGAAANAGKSAANIGKKMADIAKSLGNSLKPILRAFLQFLKAAGKAILTFLKWLGSLIIAYWWVLLIIIAVVIVVAVVIIVVSYVFSADWDKDKGTVSSVGGVTGDGFYGTRFMYYDDDYTSHDLANTYLEFTYNILQEVNKTTTIAIDFSIPYQTNTQVKSISLSFAGALSGATGTELEVHTSIIEHYGFTELEKDIVLGNMANYVVSRGYTSASATSVLSELKTAYDAEMAYMKNVCKKIIIKDYILEDGEYTTNIPKKDYFGFVYMPKQMVTLESSSFIFVVDEEKQVQTQVMYLDGMGSKLLEEATADSTWFVNGVMEKALNVVDAPNYILNEFTAIDKSNLTYLEDGKTLFQILRDEKMGTYFKNINLEDLNKSKSETNDTLLKNINTGNCLYIQMEADAPFNLAESFVTVKKY